MTTKKRSYFLPVVSTCMLLLVGLATLALLVILPLPEERAWWAHVELSRITIKSVRWENITPRKAVEELNREIQKAGCTRYRLIHAEGANDPVILTDGILEGDDIPVTEVVRYLVELSGNRTIWSPKGIVIERLDIDPKKAELLYPFDYHHEVPSWRRNLREWIESKLPWRLPRWFEPEGLSESSSQDPFDPPTPVPSFSFRAKAPLKDDSRDPFAPKPSISADPPSGPGPLEVPFAPSSGPSPRDPFALPK